MEIISHQDAIQLCVAGRAQIIDVRESKEFAHGHLQNALNFPLSVFDSKELKKFKNQEIFVICQSGRRAALAAELLINDGFVNVLLVDRHMDELSKNLITDSKSWTIDRQFRLTLGLLLCIGIIGSMWISNFFLIIPILLSSGLIITSIIDRCYMRMGIAMLPWNKGKKV